MPRFISFVTTDSHVISINPDFVVSLEVERYDTGNPDNPMGTGCRICMTNGHTCNVIEDQATVRRILESAA